MKADDRTAGAGASNRAAPVVRGWLRHRLPDWPRIWGACLRRTRSWPVPPRWTPRDWREELDAEGIAAACTAIRNFDPSFGLTLGSVVYLRVLSDALTRYRQESGHSPCCQPEHGGRETPRPAVEASTTLDDGDEQMLSALGSLMEDDRSLIECLFRDGRAEGQLAAPTGIRLRAMTKRKERILHELRSRRGRIAEL